jgi:hypothetical protein
METVSKTKSNRVHRWQVAVEVFMGPPKKVRILRLLSRRVIGAAADRNVVRRKQEDTLDAYRVLHRRHQSRCLVWVVERSVGNDVDSCFQPCAVESASACPTSRSAMMASPDAPGTTQRVWLVPRRRAGPARGRRSADLREKLSLEAFQSGLSWLTILRKRENYATQGGSEIRPLPPCRHARCARAHCRQARRPDRCGAGQA